jgi:nucleoid DNA-binding protein
MVKNQNKTQLTEDSVDDFLNTVADEEKRKDAFVIKAMMEEISGEPAKMWGTSIVGFGTYHYKYDSGREGDFMKTGFSPRAQNLSLYIMTGFERHDEIIKDLGKFKTGKSCLYVKRLSDINEEVLRRLIKASYDHMTKKYG